MKVIRATKGIHVPVNPENPNHNVMRLVHTGLIALVPKDFKLPEDSYVEVGTVKVKDVKKGSD